MARRGGGLVVKIFDVVEDEDVVSGRDACSKEGLRCPGRCSADRCVRLWHVLRRPEAGTKKVTLSQVAYCDNTKLSDLCDRKRPGLFAVGIVAVRFGWRDVHSPVKSLSLVVGLELKEGD